MNCGREGRATLEKDLGLLKRPLPNLMGPPGRQPRERLLQEPRVLSRCGPSTSLIIHGTIETGKLVLRTLAMECRRLCDLGRLEQGVAPWVGTSPQAATAVQPLLQDQFSECFINRVKL